MPSFLVAVIFIYNCHSSKMNSIDKSANILSKQKKNEVWQLFDNRLLLPPLILTQIVIFQQIKLLEMLKID